MKSADAYDRTALEIRRKAALPSPGSLDVRELARFAVLAASSHNTQPWKFRLEAASIAILPDYSRRCSAVDPDNSHLFRSLGCAAENLVHAAEAQGFLSHVRFDSSEDAVLVGLERAACARATDLYRAIPVRQCTRHPYDGQPLEASEMKALERAAEGAGVRAILLSSAKEMESVLDLVAQGNYRQLSDPAFREELLSWIRFNPGAALSTGDGLSGRSSGRPPLPSGLARRIAPLLLTARGQNDADARNLRSSAGIAVFVARTDEKSSWVEAGRAYERFALRAATLDVRNAFLNQPIEVRALRPQLESWLKLREERAQLLVRFGRGLLAPYSLRRSLDDVIVGAAAA